MSATDEVERAAPLVLIVDDDPFYPGYVSAVLAERGIAVSGPFADVQHALDALDTAGATAAVVARGSDRAADRLVDELGRRGIAFLTLNRTVELVGEDTPVLPRPYAAYQIADWVETVIARPAS